MGENKAIIIKDFIISILIVACLVLVFSIFFYDKISLSRVIPESEDYQLSEQMQKDIGTEEIEDTKHVVTTYHIDSADLQKYEKTKEYDKGKSNPFALESSDSSIQGEVAISNNNASSDINNSQNFYEDDGTK